MRIAGAQKALVVGAFTAALVGGGAGTAAAGEITAKGKPLATTPNPDYVPGDAESSPFILKAKSICAYSGLNDEYVHAQLNTDPTDDATFARTQTPSEYPAGIPGFACSPGRPAH